MSFKSDACDFNVYDATPLKRDLIGELAEACHKNGLGIGFYYSQWADWTAPGGSGGPQTDLETDEGEVIWDSQTCGNQFVWKRLGWIHITTPDTYTLTLYPEDDAARSTRVAGLRLTPVAF